MNSHWAKPESTDRGRVAAGWIGKRMLLVWGQFCVAETIIPEAQEHFLTPSARLNTHLFGGLGLRLKPNEVEMKNTPACVIVRRVGTNGEFMGAIFNP